MQEILKTVSDNPLVPIGGILLGVIGIILAVVFFVRSRRVSMVLYDSYGRSLVEGLAGALEGIEVRYKGSPQERITVSHFVFWNAGTETIDSGDFTDDPLRIVCSKDIALLDHRTIEFNKATNKIQIGEALKTEDEASIILTFDYLDSKDGAIVQIVHDGSEGTQFRLMGTLKGNCSIIRNDSPFDQARRTLPPSLLHHEIVSPTLATWFVTLTYFTIGIAALVAPFRGGSWWWLVPAVFCFITMGGLITGNNSRHMPSHFQRGLGRLPMANKPSEATSQ